MIYFFNKKTGLIPCKTREQAVKLCKNTKQSSETIYNKIEQ